MKQAHDHFGRLDIVVNNAGYGHFGMIEELSEAEARDQIETNVFGALWVTQAALPLLRAQGSGHIIQVSSIGGISAFPMLGAYHASKWALEGFSQALAQEVADFGIHVTLIEPGGFSTDWAGPSSVHSVELAAYDDRRAKTMMQRARRSRCARRPDRQRRRDPARRRRREAAAARLLRRRRRSRSPKPTTPPAWSSGGSGRTWPSSPRARDSATPTDPAPEAAPRLSHPGARPVSSCRQRIHEEDR